MSCQCLVLIIHAKNTENFVANELNKFKIEQNAFHLTEVLIAFYCSLIRFASLEKETEIGVDREFLGLLVALEETRWRVADESGFVVVDEERGAFAQTQHRVVVQVMKLGDAFLARLALVLAVGVGVEVVRIDVKRRQLQSVERRRQRDRHVVRRVDRVRGDIRAGTGSDVRDAIVHDPRPDRLHQMIVVERLQ